MDILKALLDSLPTGPDYTPLSEKLGPPKFNVGDRVYYNNLYGLKGDGIIEKVIGIDSYHEQYKYFVKNLSDGHTYCFLQSSLTTDVKTQLENLKGE